MEDKYSLQDKLVNIFLRGGWEFTGRVEFYSKDKVVLMGEMGSLVIYKENIVAAMIIDERKINDSVDPELAPSYDRGAGEAPRRPPSFFIRRPPINTDEEEIEQQSLYGAIIPEDMLQGVAEEKFPVSFSVSMVDLKNIKPKENANGSTEETPKYRGKNKA
jgi:sRNA-binding regulator protein Hfq